MANRVMAAKAQKLRRQRRLFPRKMSADYISVGAPPNRLVMAEYKERTRSLAFDQKYLDWLEAVTRFRGKPPGKLEAEQEAKRIERYKTNPAAWLLDVKTASPSIWAKLEDSCPSLMNVTLHDSAVSQTRMFWNAAGDQYVLLEIHHVGRFIRCSMRYQNRERVIGHFQSGTVRWVEFVSSSPPEP